MQDPFLGVGIILRGELCRSLIDLMNDGDDQDVLRPLSMFFTCTMSPLGIRV